MKHLFIFCLVISSLLKAGGGGTPDPKAIKTTQCAFVPLSLAKAQSDTWRTKFTNTLPANDSVPTSFAREKVLYTNVVYMIESMQGVYGEHTTPEMLFTPADGVTDG